MTYWILNRAGMREMKALPELYEILKEERGAYVDYCKTYDALVALSWPFAWKTIVRTSTPMRCQPLLNHSEERPPTGGSRS